MNEPLISVVVTAYKAEKYISEALDSVKKQMYSNWEMIVVEDGSRDRTEEIVNEFASVASENRVVYIRHETNLGIGSTRNTAILNARGEYIAFLDYDDIWEKAHLSESSKPLKEHKADLVYSPATVFDCDENREVGMYKPTPEELKAFPKSLYYRNFIHTSTIIVKKNCIEKIGLFDASLRSCEDFECLIRMARAGFKFLYINEIHCLRRLHQSNLIKNIRTMVETELRVIQKHRDWNCVSAEEKAQRLADIYDRLVSIWEGIDNRKSAYFLLCAWFLQPASPHRIRRLARIFQYATRAQLKML